VVDSNHRVSDDERIVIEVDKNNWPYIVLWLRVFNYFVTRLYTNRIAIIPKPFEYLSESKDSDKDHSDTDYSDKDYSDKDYFDKRKPEKLASGKVDGEDDEADDDKYLVDALVEMLDNIRFQRENLEELYQALGVSADNRTLTWIPKTNLHCH
jgi:hypothetical protein